MRRIAVLGCGGAGKTTLARELGARLGIEVVHGDFLGRVGDVRAQGDEWRRLEQGVLARDEWILDAMRLSSLDARLARADTAIFLDLPRRTCLASILLRRLRHRGAVVEEAGVADRVNRAFVRWIWRFPHRERPVILAALEQHRPTTDVVVLRSRRAARAYLRRFGGFDSMNANESSMRPASSSSSTASSRTSTASQPR